MTGERLRYILEVGERARKGESHAGLAVELNETKSFIAVCSECYRGFQALRRQDPDFAEKALSGEIQLRMDELRRFMGGTDPTILISNTKSSKSLMQTIAIKEYTDEYGAESAKEKFDISDRKIEDAAYVYNGFQKLSSVIPGLAERIKHKTIELSGDLCKTVNSYSDDALADAADALLSGGSVSKASGIKWPDGRTRAAGDCKKNRSEEKSKPARALKAPSEELAELIAGAAGTFDASIERYVLDYPDAPKDAAITELQKAGEIINSWIERMRLNGE